MATLNQPFTDALAIINDLGVDPNTVHPLHWGILWANLICLRNRIHTEEDWQQLLKHLAWPQEHPCPEAFKDGNEYLPRLDKTLEKIYDES
jgi:hypothetical protein